MNTGKRKRLRIAGGRWDRLGRCGSTPRGGGARRLASNAIQSECAVMIGQQRRQMEEMDDNCRRKNRHMSEI